MSEDWEDYIPFEGPPRRMTPGERKDMEQKTRALDAEILAELQKQRDQRRGKLPPQP